jgi:hypothetical protein
MPVISGWEELPKLPVLRYALWVRVSRNGEPTWLLCPGCELLTIRMPGSGSFDRPVECLHLSGAEVGDRGDPPKSIRAVGWVVPVRYLTYIGLGPGATRSSCRRTPGPPRAG